MDNILSKIPSGVIGIDGETPILSDGRWRQWNREELWEGREGLNKYVPKVDDYAVIPKTGDLFIVTHVDQVTMIPTLVPIKYRDTTITDDLLSSTDQNYRIYYDKTQNPYTLTPDAFLYSYSAEATVARIYRGTVVEDNNIISRVYNNSGVFIGHDIPLNLVAFETHDNYAIKSIPGCSCNVELLDGEACTIVIFDSRGKVVNRTVCIIENTTYIPQAYAEQRYIVNIALKSNFINDLDQSTINFPINLTLDSFNPIGVVYYNDGTENEFVVDGSKFNLYGLDTVAERDKATLVSSFASTTIGHKVALVLTYKMDRSEKTIMSVGYNPDLISRKYELVVSKPNRTYGVKIFTYPEWIDDINGYRLRYYLLNLDRDMLYDVTPYVYFTPTSPTYSPNSYGMTQRLFIGLDLSKVSASFNRFIHTQTIEIILRGPATNESLTNIWEVTSQYPTTTPFYGTNLKATLKGDQKTINVGNNCDTLEDWLKVMYYNTEPLIDPTSEKTPPLPTHFIVKSGQEKYKVSVKDYDKDIPFQNTIPLYSTLEVFFYQESAGNSLTLSAASLTIRK